MDLDVAFTRDEELNYEALVVIDRASSDDLQVQRAIRFDAQDRETGMDTYCLVRGGATHYGGITSWRVAHGVLSLGLTEQAAGALALPEQVELEVGGEAGELLLEHLPRLLT